MQQAISMYLGGDIIGSWEADHSTAKEFGLVCACCHEPVIFRSGSTVKKTDKRKAYTIPPHFVHYSKNLSNSVCENRILSDAKVRDRIRKEVSKGKNQRLDLYNNKLWQLFNYDVTVERWEGKEFVQVKNIIGKKTLNDFAKFMIKDWAVNLPRIKERLKENLNRSDKEFEATYEDLKKKTRDRERLEWLESYFLYQTDITKKALHAKICLEIYDFLATYKSCYFWKEFIASHILREKQKENLSKKEKLWRNC